MMDQWIVLLIIPPPSPRSSKKEVELHDRGGEWRGGGGGIGCTSLMIAWLIGCTHGLNIIRGH